MTRQMNQPEEKLSAALRELAACSRRGASPELAVTLKDAFRRHHSKQRRTRRAYAAAIVICLMILAALPFFKKFFVVDKGNQTTAVRTIPPEETPASSDVNVSQARPGAIAKSSVLDRRKPLSTEEFVLLPAMDSPPPDNELRVVRLELPVKALRLVGVPVGEEVPDHRVLADFVVGPDTTPYAVRVVRSSFSRGE